MKKTNVYELVTERIIAELDKGIIPWFKPWTGTAGAWSRSTGRAYSLLNQWLMPQGEYATFNQIKKEGGKVRKGSKGYIVVFFKPTQIERENPETGEKEKRTVPVLRYYTVFNIAEQTDLQVKHSREDIAHTAEPLEMLENIKQDYINREQLTFRQVESNKACYNPVSDTVTMPLLEQFDTTGGYYSTLFHELAHSTGHATRLNRIKSLACFGSDDYGKEELIAEITAAAVLNETGIENNKTLQNSTAYIQNWRDAIKADNRLVVQASSKAQKAFEMLMGLETGEK